MQRTEREISIYLLQIQAQCYDRFFEVSPDEPENAELMVEDAMSRILLDLFGGGTVDDVTILFSADLRMGLLHCSVQIRAQCACKYLTARPETTERIKRQLASRTGTLLRELFGSVKVDQVMLNPFPGSSGRDPEFSWSL